MTWQALAAPPNELGESPFWHPDEERLIGSIYRRGKFFAATWHPATQKTGPRKQGGSLAASVLLSLGSTLLAAIALLVSIPLWLIPPLILVLPPLIWGWLTYRVMSYDALVDHASAEERKQIFREHHASLLSIGVISGYLGAAPSLLWASGAMFIAMAPILVPVAIWIYTLVFAFSSLWFAHYTLAALAQLRKKNGVLPPQPNAPDAVKTIVFDAPVLIGSDTPAGPRPGAIAKFPD